MPDKSFEVTLADGNVFFVEIKGRDTYVNGKKASYPIDTAARMLYGNLKEK